MCGDPAGLGRGLGCVHLYAWCCTRARAVQPTSGSAWWRREAVGVVGARRRRAARRVAGGRAPGSRPRVSCKAAHSRQPQRVSAEAARTMYGCRLELGGTGARGLEARRSKHAGGSSSSSRAASRGVRRQCRGAEIPSRQRREQRAQRADRRAPRRAAVAAAFRGGLQWRARRGGAFANMGGGNNLRRREPIVGDSVSTRRRQRPRPLPQRAGYGQCISPARSASSTCRSWPRPASLRSRWDIVGADPSKQKNERARASTIISIIHSHGNPRHRSQPRKSPSPRSQSSTAMEIPVTW